jgi:serine/threonine-protein kinase
MEDLSGRQFGPYRIVGPLGEGGMAAVYKAYQPVMDRYIALKILPRHFAGDPEFIGRFRQEAKVLAQLQHVHILPVFDFGEEDGYMYLVMPFVEGGTLTNLLRGQPLPLQQIRSVISQVGGALNYAHSQGLVHRDVKPSNVLIDRSGNCLLSDFGIAKIVEGSAKFTVTGGMVGTPAYMSPEQGLGLKPDGRSDIYALGIIMYEMATGRVPHTAETPMAVVVKHINDPVPPPRKLNPALAKPVEQVILKALAKQPDRRYATAGAMVQAVQAAIPETAPPAKAGRAGPVAMLATLAAQSKLARGKPEPDLKRVRAIEEPKSTIRMSGRPARSTLLKWIFVAGGLAFLVAAICIVAIVGAGTIASRSVTQTAAAAALLREDTPHPIGIAVQLATTQTPAPSATHLPPTASETSAPTATETFLPTASETLMPTGSPIRRPASTLTRAPEPTTAPRPTACALTNGPAWSGGATNIQPENHASQTFKPIGSEIKYLDVGINTINQGGGGDTITMRLLAQDGSVLATGSAFVEEGFNGWQRFGVPNGGINVEPGQILVLELSDTGKTVFGWKYVGDTYSDGTAIFGSSPVTWDYFFIVYSC